jgi:TldD protein
MSYASSTRRGFLATATRAAAASAFGGSLLSARDLGASPRALTRSSVTPRELLADPLPPDALRTLAMAAVEAGRAAGASFTDVRVAEREVNTVELSIRDFDPVIWLETTFQYGVRVLVNGVWAFEHGTAATIDGVAAAARRAVASARGYNAVSASSSHADLSSNPATTGSWETPIEIDSFGVSLQDQFALLAACRETAQRVLGGGTAQMDGHGFGVGIKSAREVRTFASSEGALLTQTLFRTEPNIAVGVGRGTSSVTVWSPTLVSQAAGYEAVHLPDLQEQLKSLTEEAAQIATLPQRPMEVGRYPVVFDGFSTGALLGQTIGHALELDRVRGDDADASGTSYLAPPDTTLGMPLFASLLNVTGHRAHPTFSAVKWDDEGVEPAAHQVIAEGRVVDYHSGRDSAPLLRDWYQRQGRAIRSNGCAVAPSAGDPVLIRAPHLTMATGSASLDDMIKGVTRGVLIRQVSHVSVAQQMGAGSIVFGAFFEIERGQVVRRIAGAALQFNTKAIWKSLTAVGDPSTMRTSYVREFKGQPWVLTASGATAPAAVFKDVNVVTSARSFT